MGVSVAEETTVGLVHELAWLDAVVHHALARLASARRLHLAFGVLGDSTGVEALVCASSADYLHVLLP